jgi:ABC-type sulfate transport system permease subunit
MGKDGDSEEDNDEEVVKQVVKRRFEGRGYLPIICLPFSLRPLYPSLYIHFFMSSSSYLSAVPSST